MESRKPKVEEKISDHSSFFSAAEKPSYYEKIRRHVLRGLFSKKYPQLEQDMAKYSLTGEKLTDFFSKEGVRVLGFSLTLEKEALEFLIKKVPIDSLEATLKQDDFSVLRDYVGTQIGLEKLGFYKQKTEDRQISTFKILLSIDAEAVTHFMESLSTSDSPPSEKIMANFGRACQQFTQENIPSEEKLPSKGLG